MHKLGGLVHAPMNCTTFLCRTLLQYSKEVCKSVLRNQAFHREITVDPAAVRDP